MDIGRPEKSEASFPLALLWKGKGSRSKTDLSEYRRELDDLDPTKVTNTSSVHLLRMFVVRGRRRFSKDFNSLGPEFFFFQKFWGTETNVSSGLA